jgi:hypothetical protein
VAKDHVQQIVRSLNGLVGAEALRRSIEGISRRQAARLKAQTLIEMERAHKAALKRVTITAPGVVRGMDAMHLRSVEGRCYALFCADAAVPYRTSVTTGSRYDASLVVKALSTDIERNGAPIVYRLDRARAHGALDVRAVLDANEILVLHGPPRYPRFYGQLERQNREHRAWAQILKELPREEVEPCLERMLYGVNDIWKRRTLGWKTAAEAWSARLSSRSTARRYAKKCRREPPASRGNWSSAASPRIWPSVSRSRRRSKREATCARRSEDGAR